jgi:hypothetical protein
LKKIRILKYFGFPLGSNEILVGVDSYLLIKKQKRKIKALVMMLINLYLCKQKEEID